MTRPPDWVLLEAAKRSGWGCTIEFLRDDYPATDNGPFRALCDMIERYEQPPVDRKLLCAHEAFRQWISTPSNSHADIAVRGIELWEEGFGK